MPTAIGVGVLALVSMSLIAWSHMGWRNLQHQARAFDTDLSASQLAAHRSHWHAEQQVLSHVVPAADEIREGFTEASRHLQHLQANAPQALTPLVHTLMDELQVVRDATLTRLHTPSELSADALKATFDRFDAQVLHVAQRWEQSLQDATDDQLRVDKVNIVLLGGLSVVLLALLARAHRQRERAMIALRGREAEMRAFAEVLPDLAFHMDAQGHYLHIYGNNLPLLGRPPHEMIGRHLRDDFNEEMTHRFMHVIEQARATGQAQTVSFAMSVQGEIRHFDGRCAPIADTEEVAWMIWDTTARRQTERRLRRKTRMYDFLSHVNQAIVRSTSESALLDRVCQVAVDHGQFRKAWVALFRDDELADRHQLACVAEAGDERPRIAELGFELLPQPDAAAALDHSLREGLTFRTADLSQVLERPHWADLAVGAGMPGCVTVPLYRNRQLIGHLILLGKRVDDQDADELSLFEDLSSDLSFAMTNLHREALRAHAEQRIRLHAAALESTRDGMVVLSRDKRIVSINPAFTALTGYEEGEIVGQDVTMLLPDRPEEILADIRAVMMSQGAWQGEVWFRRKSGDLFMIKLSVSAVTSDEQRRPSHLVGVFTDITQLKQTEERLARMAHFDTLTELPNRLMIRQRLAHAINLAQRHHTLVGVIFIDLDNFKTVNDGLGHAAGDSLLTQVAQRLRERVRQEDTLGRLGGDEFILVLEHLRHPQQAAHVAAAILETLGEPFTLEGGQPVYVRASIGIALYPADGTDAAELVRNADAAMYESKRRGRNHFSFYTSSFTSAANNRLQLETRLRRAVEHGEFMLHYQPMMRLTDRKMVAVEALVRLKAPTESDMCLPSINPNEFIPVMEETGMIVALSEWVLQEACRQGKAWLDAGLDFGRLAVNLSPSEIRRGGVVERISRILQRSGLPPERLEVEITESGLMESGTNAEQFLQAVNALGVHLSIDDFGTGYSSLAYLKRFPVHQLKIDRSFVQDLPGNDSDSQLVATMIAMAHGLKLQVVAEGVEMPDQEAFLANLGCDIVQGYLYSRPVPAAQIEHLLTLQ